MWPKLRLLIDQWEMPLDNGVSGLQRVVTRRLVVALLPFAILLVIIIVSFLIGLGIEA